MEFGYARVSTSHQNTDRQIEALLEYGIPERNIIVDKQSGKDFERVGYLALKNTMLRAGDTLVIKELDRLGRNKQMIKEELEWLKAHEIRVKILNVPTSLMECDGQDWILEMVSNILIEVMASIAEEERLKNHQRQSEGIQAAKNRGVVFGRPTVRKPENYEAVMEKVARIVEQKRFVVGGAKYTEDLKRFHRLQDEYLLLVNNDIKSVVQIVDFISEQEEKIQQIEDRQHEIYRENSSRKRNIKNEEQHREYQIWHVEVQEELDELK